MTLQDPKRSKMGTARRRSQRVILDATVLVRGELAGNGSFQEETFTVVVNAHGALIVLAAKVELGQRLVLMNPETNEEQEARVVYMGRAYAGMAQVGIAFARPAPGFWPVASPPDDWKALLP